MGHSWEKGWLEDWIWGLFWTHPMRLCLRHVESTVTWLVWIEAALCFVAVTFWRYFWLLIQDWHDLRGDFISCQTISLRHLHIYRSSAPGDLDESHHDFPMAVIVPPLPFSNAMFPGKQHHDLLVDPFLFSPFPSHTVAATHLWRNSQPNKPPLAQLS